MRHGAAGRHPGRQGRGWAATDWKPVLEAVAARLGARVSRWAPCRPAARRSRRSCRTAIEKRLSSHKEEFGQGAIEGVAGPEAANNASAAGTLVPLLALGLPTSATAAILLAAFQQYGLQPGPLLFETSPSWCGG